MGESTGHLLELLDGVKALFHDQIAQQTSACLYGSATTKEWVPSRSDLDLFVFLPEASLDLLGEKIQTWKAKPGNPILDGFIVYSSSSGAMVREFHGFEKAYPLTENFIPLIDLWNIKNRSRHLFGQDVKAFVREIDRDDLKRWAIKDIEQHWIPLIHSSISNGAFSSEPTIPLSSVVVTASAVARMLMLVKGEVCSSKREALTWLAAEHSELQELADTLGEEFEKPDEVARKFTSEQTAKLGQVYLRLLRTAKH